MLKLMHGQEERKKCVHFSVAFNGITILSFPFYTISSFFPDFAFAYSVDGHVLSCSVIAQLNVHSFWFNYAFAPFLPRKMQEPKDDRTNGTTKWEYKTMARRRREGNLTWKEWVIQSAFHFIALSSTSSLSTVSEIFPNGNEVFHFSTSTSAQFKTFAFTLPRKNRNLCVGCTHDVYIKTSKWNKVKKNRSSASSTGSSTANPQIIFRFC